MHMHIKTVGSYEAKTHLPALLDAVEQGEKVIITRRGQPVAILVPYKEENISVDEVIEEIIKAHQGLKLDGLSIIDMKNEGRRF
jgi:prevent-host-death family protein